MSHTAPSTAAPATPSPTRRATPASSPAVTVCVPGPPAAPPQVSCTQRQPQLCPPSPAPRHSCPGWHQPPTMLGQGRCHQGTELAGSLLLWAFLKSYLDGFEARAAPVAAEALAQPGGLLLQALSPGMCPTSGKNLPHAVCAWALQEPIKP